MIGFIVARFGEQDAGHSYENFLLVIGYWITPYLGVIFTDYWLRRGKFDVATWRQVFSVDHLKRVSIPMVVVWMPFIVINNVKPGRFARCWM